MDISAEEKPDRMNVELMFDKNIIIPDLNPLAESTYNLNIDNMTLEHIASCSTCSIEGVLHSSCYFNIMQ